MLFPFCEQCFDDQLSCLLQVVQILVLCVFTVCIPIWLCNVIDFLWLFIADGVQFVEFTMSFEALLFYGSHSDILQNTFRCCFLGLVTGEIIINWMPIAWLYWNLNFHLLTAIWTRLVCLSFHSIAYHTCLLFCVWREMFQSICLVKVLHKLFSSESCLLSPPH